MIPCYEKSQLILHIVRVEVKEGDIFLHHPCHASLVLYISISYILRFSGGHIIIIENVDNNVLINVLLLMMRSDQFILF